MSNHITRPEEDEYASFYHTYISKVKADDLIDALTEGREKVLELMKSIPEDKYDYSYQEGKWTIKEVFVHHMDVERIFTYRALRFSRNDQTAVPGFDEDQYIPESNTAARSMQSIIDEYLALRQSTIEFFKNITEEMSRRSGIANGRQVSVRALGFIIPGHELHHINVIKERYL